MNHQHAKVTRRMREYKSLEALVSACLEGAFTQEEFANVLKNIRFGIGLAKRDRYLAEGLEGGVADMASPAYQSGFDHGYAQGLEDGKAQAAAEQSDATKPANDNGDPTASQ